MGVSGSAAQNENQMNKLTNNHAPVKCSKSILIHATPQEVWNILTNIDQWDNWQTDIRKPKLMGELKPNTRFDWETGGAKIRSTLHTVQPYKEIGWTGETFGARAIHNWTIAEVDGATQVSVDECMEGLMTWLFKDLFNKNLAKGMQHWLELLKAKCEDTYRR